MASQKSKKKPGKKTAGRAVKAGAAARPRRRAGSSKPKSKSLRAKSKPPMKAVERYVLPSAIDTGAAQALMNDLAAIRGRALEIDAGKVQRVGTLSVQVLLSAVRTWAADGQRLSFVDITHEFRDALGALGLRQEALPVLSVMA